MLVPATSVLLNMVSASGCLMHHQLHAGRGMLEAARLSVNSNRVSTRGRPTTATAPSATATAACRHHAKDQ